MSWSKCWVWPLVAIFGAVPVPGKDSGPWRSVDKVGSKNSYLHREGNAAALHRTGPWVIFPQRFVPVKDGQRIDSAAMYEVMAVNCLTGASRAITSMDYDDNGHALGMKAPLSMAEVEATTDFGRVNLLAPRDTLQQGLVNIACQCQRAAGALTATEAELQGVYDKYMRRQMTQRRYRVRYIRVDSEADAQTIIDRLDRGASFLSQVQRYSTATEFKDGEIGFDAAGRWTAEQVRVFNALRPGAYTRAPHRGVFGWDLYQLLAVQEIPPPDFASQRAVIAQFVSRASACGWDF